MASKLKDLILQASDRSEKLIDIPEWNTSILILEMSGAQRDDLYDKATDEDGTIKRQVFLRHLLVSALHDPETREPIFELADADELAKKSGAVLQRLANIAMEINGLGTAAVAEERKNLNGSPSEDSSLSLQKV